MANRGEIETLMTMYAKGNDLNDMLEIVKSQKLITKIKESLHCWDENELKKSLIAARYLKSVESNKGEHALELAYQLRKNLEVEQPIIFIVPPYIEKAILWACGQEEREYEGN